MDKYDILRKKQEVVSFEDLDESEKEEVEQTEKHEQDDS